MEIKTREELEALAKPPTTAQVEELKKSVAEIKELAQRAEAKDKEFEQTIKDTVSEVLKSHPGFTANRKIEFPDSQVAFTPEQKAERIIRRMPVELRRQVDEIFLMSAILEKPANHLKVWGDFCDQAKEHKKALDTSTSGGASEWMPTGFTSEFFEFVRIQARVASLFRIMNMPVSPYVAPVGIGRLQSFLHNEQTADSSQTTIPVGDTGNISQKLTLTAVGHAVQVLTSKDAEEDAMVPLLSWLQGEIVTAMAEGREDCILNGDTTGSHEDTDITAANARRKMWKGFRRSSHDGAYTRDLSTFNLSNLRLMRSDMGKFGVTPSNLAWVVGVKGYIKMLDIAEVVTVDKYGNNATVLNGELGKLDGIPIVVSEFIREDLNASGLFQAAQTKTCVHLVYRPGWVIGERRQVKTQLLKELYAASDQDALIVKERVVLAPVYPVATNKIVWTGQNI